MMTSDSSIRIERTYHTSVEQVWEALTNASAMRLWYFDIPDFRLEKGARFRFFEPGGAQQFAHYAEILAVEPQKELRHTWTYPDLPNRESILTWQLVPRGTATFVKLVHEGIDHFADAGADFSPASFRKGWEAILGRSLAAYLES